jgi:hypothetical protein
MVVVACCLGLGSLLLLSDPEASPDSASVPIGLSDGPVWSWTWAE